MNTKFRIAFLALGVLTQSACAHTKNTNSQAVSTSVASPTPRCIASGPSVLLSTYTSGPGDAPLSRLIEMLLEIRVEADASVSVAKVLESTTTAVENDLILKHIKSDIFRSAIDENCNPFAETVRRRIYVEVRSDQHAAAVDPSSLAGIVASVPMETVTGHPK